MKILKMNKKAIFALTHCNLCAKINNCHLCYNTLVLTQMD